MKSQRNNAGKGLITGPDAAYVLSVAILLLSLKAALAWF